MTLIESIIARAKSNKQRIVLPESLEERTLTAADQSLADEIADIILIGNPDEIFALADKLGLKNIGKATIIDPATSEKTAEYANPMSDRWQMVVEWLRIRKLTPLECERLQTMPDNYTEWVSDTQRYKMLWNWWTCDVIAHIFSFIKTNNG